MKKWLRYFFLTPICLSFLAACGNSPTPIALNATFTPLPTSTATATATPLPTVTPSPDELFQQMSRYWKVAFIEPTTRLVCVMNGDYSGKVCLDYLDYDPPKGNRHELGSWSPDGSRFAINRNNDTGIFIWEVSHSYTWNPSVSVTKYRESGEGLVFRFPDWSPDGNSLAYEAESVAFWDISPDVPGLYVESLDHSIRQRITPALSSSSWSPDGKKMAFTSGDMIDFWADIFTADPDGTNIVNLTGKATGGQAPIWSPDGLQIAFLRKAGGKTYNICVMEPDGSGAHVVAQVEWSNIYTRFNYAWLPDGNHILYEDQLVDILTGTVARLHFYFDTSSAVWFMKNPAENP